MQRKVYEKLALQDFNVSKVECLAVANNGQRIFVGTNDGSLLLSNCRFTTAADPGALQMRYRDWGF